MIRLQTAPKTKDNLIDEIRQYWDIHIHDLKIATKPMGSPGFFQELDEYRFDKQRYLPQLVSFGGYRGKQVLEVGCGIGIDLVRFARGGAQVTGIDLSETAISLAAQNFSHSGLNAELLVMNGEAMEFPDDSFDLVYSHGVIQYTANDSKMIREIHRVLRPGGEAILMVNNRFSWLNALSKVTQVELEFEDAPVTKIYSIADFRKLLEPFDAIRIVTERFPVESRLHQGWKAFVYNKAFVQVFNLIPGRITRPFGWHIMAFGGKNGTATG